MAHIVSCLGLDVGRSGIMRLIPLALTQRLAATAAAAATRNLHGSSACASLQQQQIRPANELYMNGLVWMQQPWKAVLVDAAGGWYTDQSTGVSQEWAWILGATAVN